MGQKTKKRISNIVLNILTVIVVFITLAPLLWFIQIALKPQVLAFKMPPEFIFVPTFENFGHVLGSVNFLNAYKNSFIVSFSTTAIALLLGITSGYSLARAKSKIFGFMGVWIILSRMSPPMVFLLPFYVMLRAIGWHGTLQGIIITYLVITIPFVTWLMSSYFKTVPLEVEEAAFIDGCNRIEILFRVCVPIAVPGIVTAAIFTFIAAWNEFLFALILTQRSTKTVPILIQGFMSSDGIMWGDLASTSIFVIAPVLLVTMVSQKGFVRGLVGGAIK